MVAIRLVWPLAEAIVIPPQARISIAGLVGEHFEHMMDLDAYLDQRWPPLMAWHYPFAYLVAVAGGLVAYGGLASLLSWSWANLIRTALAGSVGALVGYELMVWVPMPDPLVQGTVMAVLALFFGMLVPVVMMQPGQTQRVRGTQVGQSRGHSGLANRRAIRSRRTALAGTVLEAQAETHTSQWSA